MIADGRYIDDQKVLDCDEYKGYNGKRVIKNIVNLRACHKTKNGCFKSWFCFMQMLRHSDGIIDHAARAVISENKVEIEDGSSTFLCCWVWRLFLMLNVEMYNFEKLRFNLILYNIYFKNQQLYFEHTGIPEIKIIAIPLL